MLFQRTAWLQDPEHTVSDWYRENLPADATQPAAGAQPDEAALAEASDNAPAAGTSGSSEPSPSGSSYLNSPLRASGSASPAPAASGQLSSPESNSQESSPPPLTGYEPRAMYLCLLGVLPQFQKRGVATQLMDYADQYGDLYDAALTFMHVIQYNTSALKFYWARGYRPVGLARAFYTVRPGEGQQPDRQQYDAYLLAKLADSSGGGDASGSSSPSEQQAEAQAQAESGPSGEAAAAAVSSEDEEKAQPIGDQQSASEPHHADQQGGRDAAGIRSPQAAPASAAAPTDAEPALASPAGSPASSQQSTASDRSPEADVGPHRPDVPQAAHQGSAEISGGVPRDEGSNFLHLLSQLLLDGYDLYQMTDGDGRPCTLPSLQPSQPALPGGETLPGGNTLTGDASASGDLPDRSRHSPGSCASLPASARAPLACSIARWPALRCTLQTAGAARYGRSHPASRAALRGGFARCASQPLRKAAGWTSVSFGTGSALPSAASMQRDRGAAARAVRARGCICSAVVINRANIRAPLLLRHPARSMMAARAWGPAGLC